MDVVCSRGRYEGEESDLPREEVHDGVRIHRVSATALGRGRMLHRVCDYATFYATALRRCLSLPRMDVCVALTTPPFVASIGAAYKRIHRASLILWAMDLYPDIAAAMGVLRPSSIEHRVLRRLAVWIYQNADRIVSLGGDMTERLRRCGVPEHRITTVPNWSPGEAVRPCPDTQTPFRQRHGINGHFVVMYSGNMGVVHEFGTILGAAQRLRHREDVLFLFVGGGAQKQYVMEETRRRGLDNVKFCPYQPLSALSDSLGAADVHLISMKNNVEGLLVPSKLYGIMAAGRPALMVGPRNNEIARTLEVSRAGWVVPPGHPHRLAEQIERLLRRPDLVKAMGSRARRHYELCCSRRRRTGELVAAIEQTVAAARKARCESGVRR